MLPENYQAIQTVAPDWPWRTVRAALLQRGVSLAEVAIAAGYKPSCGRALYRQTMPAVQAEIAQALGYSPMAIWPTRYADDGRPLSTREWQQKMASATSSQHIVLPVVVP